MCDPSFEFKAVVKAESVDVGALEGELSPVRFDLRDIAVVVSDLRFPEGFHRG